MSSRQRAGASERLPAPGQVKWSVRVARRQPGRAAPAAPRARRCALARTEGRARRAGRQGGSAGGGGERAVGGVSLWRMRAGRSWPGLYIGLAPAPAEPSCSGSGGEELLVWRVCGREGSPSGPIHPTGGSLGRGKMGGRGTRRLGENGSPSARPCQETGKRREVEGTP
jgi:hypothetical protein